MKVDLFVLRKHIFYFLFWWNIWRSMTSDTRLFRVLLLKSNLMQFSYTCVDWIKRSQDNLLHVLLLKKFIVCWIFFCFFNFCRKILNTLHQIYATFQILREYSNKAKVSTLFPDKPSKRNLKLLKSCERWIVWSCRNIFSIFCFAAMSDEIWRQILSYFVSCFWNRNIFNFPIPVLVELTEAKTISSCFDYWRSSMFAEPSFAFFNFCQKILNTLHQIYATFQISREYSNIAKVSTLFADKPSKET